MLPTFLKSLGLIFDLRRFRGLGEWAAALIINHLRRFQGLGECAAALIINHLRRFQGLDEWATALIFILDCLHWLLLSIVAGTRERKQTPRQTPLLRKRRRMTRIKELESLKR